MKIYKHLKTEHILLDVSRADKDAVIRFVAETFARIHVVKDAQQLFDNMQARENTMSTGIGRGVGIPHAASLETTAPALVLVRLQKPIDFKALDHHPVDIILALVVPENQTSLHLQLLAGISRLCENAEFLNLVRNADSSEDLRNGIKLLEQKMAFH